MVNDFKIARSPIITGVDMVDANQELPYEMEASGFYEGLSRRGIWRDGNAIGIICIITTNFGNPSLGQGTVVDAMAVMKEFFISFIKKYFA